MLKDKPYRYEAIWLPHDASAKTLSTNRSTIEQMLQAGFPCRKVPRLDRQHGIDAVRMILPKCRFDQEKCFAGIEALRAYRRRFNEIDKQFSNEPLHDWASDGSDAFRYMSLVCKDSVQVMTAPETFKVDNQATYDFSLNDLFQEREAFKNRDPLRI